MEIPEEDHERLKTAIHYTVGKICQEIGAKQNKTFTKEVMAAISEMAYQQCHIFAKDLELFAKHGKRTTINPDDVLLLVRRNEKLLEVIQKVNEEIKSETKVKKKPEAKAAAVTGEGDSDLDNFA